MKICVSSPGDTLDSEADDEFGMCEYFIIIDPVTMEYKAVLNEASHSPTSTGHQAAQAVVDMKVDVVLTGFVGHHDLHILQSTGIKVATCFEGTLRSAVQRYKTMWLGKSA